MSINWFCHIAYLRVSPGHFHVNLTMEMQTINNKTAIYDSNVNEFQYAIA